MRTVNVVKGEKFDEATKANRESAAKVVAYLSNWAASAERFRHCYLYLQDDGNAHAVYRDHSGKTTYSIFAMMDESGHYSTHS